MRPRRAFTLVELLTAIAIISVLAALLLPTLERSLEMSRRIVCMNSEKQQYVGAMQYSLDSNNVLPWHRSSDDGYDTINNKCYYRASACADTGLNTFISKKYLTADLYCCPSQTYAPNFSGNSNSGHSGVHYAYRYNSYRAIFSNYSNNGDCAVPGCSHSAISALPGIEIRRLIDRGMKQIFTTPAWQSKALFSDYGAANNGCAAYKAGSWAHGDGGNAVLHDGSALWIPGPEPLENVYGGMDYSRFDPMVRSAR